MHQPGRQTEAWRREHASGSSGSLQQAGTLRVVIADGRAVFAAALEALLSQDEGFLVLRSCTSGTEALNLIKALEPDVALIGLRTPPDSGIDVIKALRKQQITCPVVLIADVIGEEETMDALRIGVNGIVLSDMPPALLNECLRQVADGKQWLEKVAVSRALDMMLRRQDAERVASESLTPREIELVRLVSDGLKNKEIARKLAIQEGTVKVYLNTIYKKLEVNGRMELARHAHKTDLI